ncbi:hypothetical protein, partial [Burkholderia gladioli]|uniref:hypothetical protein n=1 Tax=Burkholderia gladioli TaxID=28095 RepID=UPI0019D6EF7E
MHKFNVVAPLLAPRFDCEPIDDQKSDETLAGRYEKNAAHARAAIARRRRERPPFHAPRRRCARAGA